MRLKELIKDLDYTEVENINNCEIKGISANSNSIQQGYLFVAIKGERYDGHNFLSRAIDKGAGAIILQKDSPVKKKVAKILVADTRVALASACATFFGHPAKKLKIIGITGTNGKTTVSYLIERILSCAGYPAGVIGTVNYRLGNKVYLALNTTPPADRLQSFLQEITLAQGKYAIIEVSSHALTQRRVDCIDFTSAIFTNLTPEHLDYHGSLSKYFSVKSSLFERLAPFAFAIVNVDDPYGRKLVKKIKAQKLSYGIECLAQIRAKDIRLGIAKTQFTVITPGGEIEIESSLIGRHNVYNILAAVGAAFIENIDLSHIALGINSCVSVSGRLERIDCGQNFFVFVDYAHTQDALMKVLKTLRQSSENKIILVFGCGGERDKAKRPEMGKVAVDISDFVIITTDNPRSENPRQIISDIEKGIGKKTNKYKVVLDRFQAIRQALSCAGKGDIVVIAGKGHESTQIFADKVIPFNDRQAVEKILNVYHQRDIRDYQGKINCRK